MLPPSLQSLARVFRPSSRRRAGAPSRADERQVAAVVDLCRALLSERGEVSGARLAREAVAAYTALDERTRDAFFDRLVDGFSPDPQQVARVADAYRREPSQQNLIALQRVVEAARQELFRRLNMAPGGTAALVGMRARVLAAIDAHPQWAGIESDLAHLLSSWFNPGFLGLARIDWRAPALVLEKLIQYEAVHEMQGWNDLRRRLGADRRCYAFFHPALPDEPLIFIEVALTRGISAKVQPLLDPDSPLIDARSANTAVFYSITSCQPGLRGVSFGNLLVKQVVEDLGRELPRVKTFATLSPIAGFRDWAKIAARDNAAVAAIAAQLDTPDWQDGRSGSATVQRDLTRLCAHYLLHAKNGTEPHDAVERFHLGNGARLERINWLADTSPAGLKRAAGMMVNYVYRLADVERNHEAYARERRVVASRAIERLAAASPLAGER
jgi:malonyl-CoA decarboxylase